MKRKAKRILGSCGLLAVGLTTTFAAFLPTPTTSAVASVTDTISLRVVPNSPWVQVTGINSVVAKAEQSFLVEYSGADTVDVALDYTVNSTMRASTDTVNIGTIAADYEIGQQTYTVNLRELVGDNGTNFSYGNYVVTAWADGYQGNIDTAVLPFEYVPATAHVEERDDGFYYAVLDYEYDETEDGEVHTLKITVTGQNDETHIINVANGDKEVRIPFEDYVTENGNYTFDIAITAYDRNGDALYEPFDGGTVIYEATGIPNTGAPDTGAWTGVLNISKNDYLITGMIIFGTIVIAGVVFVVKGSKRK